MPSSAESLKSTRISAQTSPQQQHQSDQFIRLDDDQQQLQDQQEGDISTSKYPTQHSPKAAKTAKAFESKTVEITPTSQVVIEVADKHSLLTASKSLYSQNSQAVYWPIWRHPRFNKHRTTIMVALLLLVVGIVFFGLSFHQFAVYGSNTAGWVFLIIGLLTILPGGYQTVYIYKAFRGVPGYNFSGIASFD